MQSGNPNIDLPELESVRRLRESREGMQAGRREPLNENAGPAVCPQCGGPLNKMGECSECMASEAQEGGPGSGPRKGGGPANRSAQQKSIKNLTDRGFKKTDTRASSRGHIHMFEHPDGTKRSVFPDGSIYKGNSQYESAREGGPGSGRHAGGGLRDPTEKEMSHEKMRIQNAEKGRGVAALIQRMNAITQPQKLHAFALALEDENYHSVAKAARAKLQHMGPAPEKPTDREKADTKARRDQGLR